VHVSCRSLHPAPPHRDLWQATKVALWLRRQVPVLVLVLPVTLLRVPVVLLTPKLVLLPVLVLGG